MRTSLALLSCATCLCASSTSLVTVHLKDIREYLDTRTQITPLGSSESELLSVAAGNVQPSRDLIEHLLINRTQLDTGSIEILKKDNRKPILNRSDFTNDHSKIFEGKTDVKVNVGSVGKELFELMKQKKGFTADKITEAYAELYREQASATSGNSDKSNDDKDDKKWTTMNAVGFSLAAAVVTFFGTFAYYQSQS